MVACAFSHLRGILMKFANVWDKIKVIILVSVLCSSWPHIVRRKWRIYCSLVGLTSKRNERRKRVWKRETIQSNTLCYHTPLYIAFSSLMLIWLWISQNPTLAKSSLNQRENLLAHLHEKPRDIPLKGLLDTMAQMVLSINFSASFTSAFLHAN